MKSVILRGDRMFRPFTISSRPGLCLEDPPIFVLIWSQVHLTSCYGNKEEDDCLDYDVTILPAFLLNVANLLSFHIWGWQIYISIERLQNWESKSRKVMIWNIFTIALINTNAALKAWDMPGCNQKRVCVTSYWIYI